MAKKNYKDEVWQQYSELPYPPRDPEDEKKRLIRASLSNLVLVNHIFWRGQKKMSDSFRVLDAGCGTGDSTIYLAEQLKSTKAEVVALDMSSHSLAIAKKRAKVRKLNNITFIEDSILNISELDLGKFDYIVSSGVLHHLEDHESGLKPLSNCLKKDGGMGILLYAQYGRNGVYMMQDLMRKINTGKKENPLENTKTILKSLNPSHWFSLVNKSDVQTGDAGIFDLLLHSRDRAYTVPDLYDFSASANLKLERFLLPALYEPDFYLKNTDSKLLLKKIKNKPIEERQAISELLNSRMTKHTFFVTNKSNKICEIDALNEKNVPVFTLEQFPDYVKTIKDKINLTVGPLQINKQISKEEKAILLLIDGKHTVVQIVESVSKEFGSSKGKILKCWHKLLDDLKVSDLICLNK